MQAFVTWKLNDENLKTLKQVLESTSWGNIMNTEDVNAVFVEFHNIFVRMYTNCSSKKYTRKTGRKNQPITLWISHGLLQCINKKNNLWTNHVNDPCIVTLEHYVEYNNASDQFYLKLKEFFTLEN